MSSDDLAKPPPPSFSSFRPLPTSQSRQPSASSSQLSRPAPPETQISRNKGKKRETDEKEKEQQKSHRDRHSDRHREKRSRGDNSDSAHRHSSKRRRRDRDESKHRNYSEGSSSYRSDHTRPSDHARDRYERLDKAGSSPTRRHHRDDIDPSRQSEPHSAPRSSPFRHLGKVSTRSDNVSSYSSRHPKAELTSPTAPTFEKNLFYTDTRGDLQAAQFGQDVYKVPNFHRYGQGKVVGLDPGLRIIKQESRTSIGAGLEVSSGGKKRFRYIDASQVWKAFRAPARRIAAPRHNETSHLSNSHAEEFIQVSRRSEKAREPGFSTLGNILNDMAEGEVSEASESQGSVLDEEIGDDPFRSVKARSRDLNIRLKDNPTDVQAWLELVDLQEQLLDLGHDPKSESASKKQSRRQVLEAEIAEASRPKMAAWIQLSILDKAISSHKNNRNSTKLVLTRLRMAAKTGRWDSEKLEKEWGRVLDSAKREAIREAADHLDTLSALWNEYLSWRESDWASFTAFNIRKVYGEAIDTLSSLKDVAEAAGKDVEPIETTLVGLAVKYIRVVEEAGFKEHAFATLQALLEFNICRVDPEPSEQNTFDAMLRRFEAFWDSEVPRLMEEGAQGWAREQEDQEQPTTSATLDRKTANPSAGINGDHPADRWSHAEEARALLRALPARTTESPLWQLEGDEMDPYSVQLFSDVRPLLFSVASQRSKLGLIDMALHALGLPANLLSSLSQSLGLMAPTNVNTSFSAISAFNPADSRYWPTSMQTEGKPDDPATSYAFIDGQIMERERTSRLSDPDSCPLRKFPVSLDTLFPASRPGDRPSRLLFTSIDPANLDSARRLLHQVSGYIKHTSIPVVRLAIQATAGAKAAGKLAKKLLSEDRENLVLWHAYARLEMARGKTTSARDVLLAALESSTALDSNRASACSHLSALWSASAELEWKAGNRDATLALIAAAARCRLSNTRDGVDLRQACDAPKKVSGIEALQIRNALAALLASSDALTDNHFCFAVFCRALFEYQIQPAGQGFSAALGVFQQQIAVLLGPAAEQNSSSVALERLLMLQSYFVQVHISTGAAYRPLDIRQALDSAIESAPSNTAILSHLAAHEMRSKIDNHLRLTLEKQLDRQKSVKGTSIDRQSREMQWLFAIFVELNLYEDHFSVHAVRRLFERTVDSEACLTSSKMWSTFLSFEIRLVPIEPKQRKDQLERAKSIFFRAIQVCPGNKDIYMTAFRAPLREVMTIGELQALYETMCEKEIRLFVEFGDFLQGWQPGEAMEEDESSDESDYDDPFDPNKPYKKREDKYEQVGGGGSKPSLATNLLSLPVELLYSIFMMARSPALPSACRWLKQVFHLAPSMVRVEYILEMWHHTHIQNLEQWRDTRYRRCNCDYVKGNRHSAPMPDFSERDSVLRPSLIPVCCPSFLLPGAGVDPISFAARFGICTPDLLVRLEMRLGQIESLRLVVQDSMLRLGTLPSDQSAFGSSAGLGILTGVELPKRIFRSLKHVQIGVSPCLKRKKGQEPSSPYDTSLLSAITDLRPTETHPVGWLPSENSLSLLLLLLTRYVANANSHSGFPLAMTVHSDVWTLACLLLSFGADPALKDALAVQIAVRKGEMDGLRSLVERDERTEARWAKAKMCVYQLVKQWIKKRTCPGYRHCCFSSTKGDEKDSPVKRIKLPDRLEPDSRLLREAIKSEAWQIVSYLMQEKNVVPDIKTLKLMDKLRM